MSRSLHIVLENELYRSWIQCVAIPAGEEEREKKKNRKRGKREAKQKIEGKGGVEENINNLSRIKSKVDKKTCWWPVITTKLIDLNPMH